MKKIIITFSILLASSQLSLLAANSSITQTTSIQRNAINYNARNKTIDYHANSYNLDKASEARTFIDKVDSDCTLAYLAQERPNIALDNYKKLSETDINIIFNTLDTCAHTIIREKGFFGKPKIFFAHTFGRYGDQHLAKIAKLKKILHPAKGFYTAVSRTKFIFKTLAYACIVAALWHKDTIKKHTNETLKSLKAHF